MKSRPSQEQRPKEAIVLVAGSGERLRPLTADCPKCLIEVAGQSLLKRLLEQLEEVGIERVVLATGYLHDVLVAQIDEWNLSLAIEAIENTDYDQSNNAVSLKLAIQGLSQDRFLLCDGDILLRHSQPLKRLIATPRDNVLSVMRFETMGGEEMKVIIDDESGRICELGKSLNPERADGESLGIQMIGPSAFSPLVERLATLDEKERRQMYYEDVFAELIDGDIDFFGCELPVGGWTEIDTAQDLKEAREMAARWAGC